MKTRQNLSEHLRDLAGRKQFKVQFNLRFSVPLGPRNVLAMV